MINKYVYAKSKGNRLKNLRIMFRERKIKELLMDCYRKILISFSSIIIFLKPKKFFLFNNRRIPYLYHKYGLTWRNERAIEVPIISEIIKKYPEKKILEVGNVISHYSRVSYDILDKYEKDKGVINKDVIDFSPTSKYDLIISISTLEHVGFDDDIKDSTKIIKAIKNLKENCLKKNGKLIVTMPINYNLEMDKLLFNNKLEFDQKKFFGRDKKNVWRKISENEAMNLKYMGYVNKGANAIVICFIKK